MIHFLESLLGLGCKHSQVAWPRTVRSEQGTETYVRCNLCGEKVGFNAERWEYV